MGEPLRPFQKLPDPPAELVAAQRAAWEAGETSGAAVAAAFGRKAAWTRAFIERAGWKRRKRGTKTTAKTKPAATRAANAKAPRTAKKPVTKTKTKAAKPSRPDAPASPRVAVPSGESDGAVISRALMRGIRAAARDLENKIASDADAREMMAAATSLIKLIAETRRNGFDIGETGDMNERAGPRPALTADDMARIRASVVAKLVSEHWPDDAGDAIDAP